MIENQTSVAALHAMRRGGMVSRPDMGDSFIFMQVPSEVPMEIISRMTSLPPAVKEKIISRALPLRYQNQFAIVGPDNNAHGWTPNSRDILAEDWRIHDLGAQPVAEGHAVAGETVGTARPLTGEIKTIGGIITDSK